MRKNIVLNSTRFLELKRKKRKVLRKKMIFIIFLAVLMLIGLAFFFRWQKININNIQISGNKIVETKMIEDVVKKDISGNYLWIFPKSNFLFYPKTEIKNELADRFKRLKDISLNIENINTLNIFLTERTALYTYCGATLDPETESPLSNSTLSQKCYFMDQDGYIFDEAPYFSGGIYLKFYGKTTANENDPSGSYFFQLYLKKLVLFNEILKKMGIKPVAFYVEDTGDVLTYLFSSSSQMGPQIIFKLDSDYDKIAENLQSVLTTEPLQSNFKNKYASLLYIDLRFGNKVYYKFK